MYFIMIRMSFSQKKGFVSRYGGDEFIIIIYIKNKEKIETIAKDIYNRIREADDSLYSVKATGKGKYIFA